MARTITAASTLGVLALFVQDILGSVSAFFGVSNIVSVIVVKASDEEWPCA